MPSLDVPPYNSSEPQNVKVTEKKTSDHELCDIHGASETPHIDAHLQQPNVRDYLLTLSEALASAADENACTKCTVESVSRTMTAYMKDVKAAKKSGALSKEDKKAMKKESKLLVKSLKRELKAMWKQE